MTMTSADALGVFTVLLAVATVLAALQEVREGRWAWPPAGTHLAQGGVVTPETAGTVRWANRAALVLRLVGPVLLLAGAAPRAAAVLTCVGLALALLLRFKHNTAFMATGMVLVACGPTVVVRGGDAIAGAGAGWTLGGVAVLLVGLYVGGALTKLQSEQFRSGSTLLLVATTRLPRVAPRLEAWPWQVWRGLASAVVVTEVALVVLLAVPGGLVAALAVGLVLHSALATIQPGRLVPFQVATLGGYPAAAAGFALLW